MRADGTLIPNGPSRNEPAWRSSRLPNTLAASKRGTHSQSIDPSGATSAPVWQSDRKAYSAIGGNGEGIAALCGIVSCAGARRGRCGRFRFACLAGRFARFGGLTTAPRGHANRRSPRRARPLPPGPMSLARICVWGSDSEAAVRRSATSPRRRPGG